MLRRGTVWLCFCAFVWSFGGTDALAADGTQAAPLPVRRVVLFTSGVAFVEHQGEVDGNQTVDLQFHVDDINDLLKSMVVEDEGGGKIKSIMYAQQGQELTEKESLRIGQVHSALSLGLLLGELRGEEIELEIDGKAVIGTIVGVDRRGLKAPNDQAFQSEVLLLKTEANLRSVPLTNTSSVKLLNPTLDKELQAALAAVATDSADTKKDVSLELAGTGKRQVRVGYIQEFPVWKTSYRLVLDDKKETWLQGWAIVENTTDQDWSDVSVSLVSGRPVSFVMDLYQPMFLQRPRVVPEMFAGLQPRVHGTDQLAAEEAFRRLGRGGGGGMGGLGGSIGGGGFGGGGFLRDPERPLVTSVVPVVGGLDFRESVDPIADGASVGTFFRYAIEAPVTLKHQKSALLPIVNQAVKSERVALYNFSKHTTHPMAAVDLTNDTKLHWMQGPLTIFDGREYAGDAKIGDVPPQATRLVTYAMDLNIAVTTALPKESPEEIVAIKINQGIVTVKRKQTRTHQYVVKNSNPAAKKVLIEQKIDGDKWTLTQVIKPTQQTSELYRFSVDAKPGVEAKLTVVEDRTWEDRVETLVQRDPFGDPIAPQDRDPFGDKAKQNASVVPKVDRLEAYQLVASVPNISPAMKQTLLVWKAKHLAYQRTLSDLTDTQLRISQTVAEQSRLKSNLINLPADSDLYRRYLTSLGEREDELAKLRQTAEQQGAEVTKSLGDLEKYLSELTVE
ncbi:MAG TPA: hypothetical protein VL096_02875 [Pirellulaceae bacterium]|nr:hypothetical protein [Pirellulaceae bacterium]